MRFLSLFAGIGGFDLGLERAGMKCVGQVEIDDYCNKVLAKHWPDVKRIRDIREVTDGEFGTVELICGGFPCQPFSVAGKQRGKKDDRYLWPEMLRVIQAYRPHWIIGENVVGIIGVEINDLLSNLEAIGYSVQLFIIPACSVDAASRRDRVWIIANSSSLRWNGWKNSQGSVLARSLSSDCQQSRCGRSGEAWGMHGESWLQAASKLCRMDDGVSDELDEIRLKQLGNAVVPQIVEVIGRAIMKTENAFLNIESDNTCN